MPDASFESLGPMLRGAVEGAKTTFVTDVHKISLPLAAQGVDHEAHVQEPPHRAGEILPWVHVVISNRESWLRGTFRSVRRDPLPRYLLEFNYRPNRRDIEDRLFFYLARRTVEGAPRPCHQLTAEALG